MTMAVVSQIHDGQVQAPPQLPAVRPVSQIKDGQPQAAPATATPVSQIKDGQPQAAQGPAVAQIKDGQPQATTAVGSSSTVQQAACAAKDTLALTLINSVLKDAQGRTGYVASNQQFQFDDPPQAGAIYTSGFSVCGNGSLALGGSAIFYQCLSGTFYNLYTVSQGLQCNTVTINALQLRTC